MKNRLLLALTLTWSAVACSPEGTVAEAEPEGALAPGNRAAVVIEAVRVFDGERVIPEASVVLADGRVAQIATPGASIEAPPGAITVDGSGRTLIPGLLDAHTHTFSRNYLKNATLFGVTAHLDMFTGDLAFLAAMNEEEERGGARDRADLFSAATLVTATGGHGTQFGIPIATLDDPADADEFIEARIAEGADYIKLVLEDGSAYGFESPTLDEATFRAAVSATHARNKLAVVHVATQEHARWAIDAGADGLVHIFGDEPPDPEVISMAAAAGIFVVPTLAVTESAYGSDASGRALVEDPIIGPRLLIEYEENLLATFPAKPDGFEGIRNSFDATRLLHEAGVPVLVGSDGPNPGTALGPTVHRELQLLVEEVGMSPLEALRAGTSAVAAAFQLEDWRGRIVVGGRADVVLVEGDPTSNILATRAVTAVWKKGQRWNVEAALRFVEERRIIADTVPDTASN